MVAFRNPCHRGTRFALTARRDDQRFAAFHVTKMFLIDVGKILGQITCVDADLDHPVQRTPGDQQAAAVGQACFSPGMIKSTYGTGCFVLVNTGDQAVRSRNRLLTTVCYRLDGKVTYAIEGSIFVAGAAVQWLRDSLGLIQSASETEALASRLADNRGVYLVPAFTGLGAPHWDAHARGGLFGITRDTGVAEIVRATVDTVVNGHVPTQTEFQCDDINEPEDGHFNGRIAIFLSGTGGLARLATDIVGYELVGGIGHFTVTAMTGAPDNDDTLVIV